MGKIPTALGAWLHKTYKLGGSTHPPRDLIDEGLIPSCHSSTMRRTEPLVVTRLQKALERIGWINQIDAGTIDSRCGASARLADNLPIYDDEFFFPTSHTLPYIGNHFFKTIFERNHGLFLS